MYMLCYLFTEINEAFKFSKETCRSLVTIMDVSLDLFLKRKYMHILLEVKVLFANTLPYIKAIHMLLFFKWHIAYY